MRWIVLTLAGCSYQPRPIDPPADTAQVVADAAIDAPIPPDQACTARYGNLDSFDLCSATATECTFYVRTNDTSCTDTCASRGGTCIQSYDGDCGNISTTPRNCVATFGDQVCVCSP